MANQVQEIFAYDNKGYGVYSRGCLYDDDMDQDFNPVVSSTMAYKDKAFETIYEYADEYKHFVYLYWNWNKNEFRVGTTKRDPKKRDDEHKTTEWHKNAQKLVIVAMNDQYEAKLLEGILSSTLDKMNARVLNKERFSKKLLLETTSKSNRSGRLKRIEKIANSLIQSVLGIILDNSKVGIESEYSSLSYENEIEAPNHIKIVKSLKASIHLKSSITKKLYSAIINEIHNSDGSVTYIIEKNSHFKITDFANSTSKTARIAAKELAKYGYNVPGDPGVKQVQESVILKVDSRTAAVNSILRANNSGNHLASWDMQESKL